MNAKLKCANISFSLKFDTVDINCFTGVAKSSLFRALVLDR